jgi:hypothetical protein
MTSVIWGVSTAMTVNVKVAQATHETPFSPCGRRVRGRGKTVMTFIIRGVSTVMTVKAALDGIGQGAKADQGMPAPRLAEQPIKPDAGQRGERQKQRRRQLDGKEGGGEHGRHARIGATKPWILR